MPKFAKKFLVFLAAISLVAAGFPNQLAQADITSCTASVSSHSVHPNEEIYFQFQVNNSDVNTIGWVFIGRPSDNFHLISTSVDGWDEATVAEGATLTLGTLEPGNTLDFTIRAQTGDVEAPAADWVVEVSDDPNGSNALVCGGDLGTEITSLDTTPPTISNVSLSALAANSVTVSWTTDELATSKVYYGINGSYGLTRSDPGLKNIHSISLVGLSPNTGYHFKVESVDATGNVGFSGDNTFVTLPSPPSGSTPSQKPVLKSTEKTPPTIKINTVLGQPFKETPRIAGEASDNAGIYSIEYSTDGGKNWLPADTVNGLGSQQASFEFTPKNLEDGDYITLARATDTSGNTAVSDKQTLVIDRLPPLVGGSVVAIGPQILEPSIQGVLFSLAGVDQKITLAATGGPTSINLVAKDAASRKERSLFSLTKSVDTGLWSGILSFKKAGTYSLVANSIDGAGNKLNRNLITVFINSPPRVINKSNSQPIEKAKLTIYYLEPESKTWVVWDGASYGQENPQSTDPDGSYKLLVPAGKYYLKVEAVGFQTLISEMFEINKSTPITGDINLKETFKINLGLGKLSLPSFSVQKIVISPSVNKLPKGLEAGSLVDKEVPLFSLLSTGGQEINSVSLRGKPTLLSFVTTWSPAAKEQMPTLESLQKNQDINIVPISTFENLAKVAVYTKIAGYDLNILIDKDGQTPEKFNLQSLPTHYFVGRKGIIKSIKTGVLSREEILDGLGGL